VNRPVRPVHLKKADVIVRRGEGGVLYLHDPFPIGPYPKKITERLEYWARETPGRAFLAQRIASGDWRTLSYGEALARVRCLAQALIDRGLSNQRPVLILSGNSIEHGLLALASMYCGILYAPIAPAYSLQARDYVTLAQIFDRVEPGLVFAAEGPAYERALSQVLPKGVELVTSTVAPESIQSTSFDELLDRTPGLAVDDAHRRVTGDAIAKILFTSGSTGRPKGVINTQRMLCSNQAMIRSVLAFLADEPPVLCDWLPWNHTAGGNHNFGLVLHNGGTFYIDEGRPVPGQIETTVRNLREISADAHFTVPRTYEALLPYLRADAVLRETFFKRLKILFYAAAGLSQKFFDDVQALAVQTLGEEILWTTGLGATETAPFAVCTGRANAFAGFVGWPSPGLEMKLAPVGEKLEARVRGPNITPGYFKDEALTRAAFDEEGFYRMGDAIRFVDPDDPAKGLMFDGRLAEDFKLSSATWVSVGPLRARILAHAAGLVQDVVLAGHDREYVAALIFPNVSRCRALCPDLAIDAAVPALLEHPAVRDAYQRIFDELARESTGSSTFVARAILLDEPPSIDAREITDKGSLNQRAVLQHRAALVDELYSEVVSPRVIVVAAAEKA
jgi:feruloyl-CoA synthase